VASAVRAVPAGAVAVVAGDGMRPAWVPGTFDRVLVDAPCSGLGALRRRPESRWRRTPQDVDELVGLQQVLLDTALDSVRPGGVVVYATCSPVVAETSEVVDAVVGRRGDTDEVDRWQLWPHRDGTDAMFAAILRRRA
jgi:16S rRNA (cytosine967-C5)-methyltransferase